MAWVTLKLIFCFFNTDLLMDFCFIFIRTTFHQVRQNLPHIHRMITLIIGGILWFAPVNFILLNLREWRNHLPQSCLLVKFDITNLKRARLHNYLIWSRLLCNCLIRNTKLTSLVAPLFVLIESLLICLLLLERDSLVFICLREWLDRVDCLRYQIDFLNHNLLVKWLLREETFLGFLSLLLRVLLSQVLWTDCVLQVCD